MFSSLVIALLVVLSHLGFSSLGSSIVSFRPVFLLLLTDATIVLGRVLLSHHGDPPSASRRETSVMNGQGIADQVGNALEMVMMMKKIMNAVSMDFSLYAVFLICGLLFTQNIFA
ncbi:BnaA08g12110D [Brassica napus]|uniref:BnaA08g12110D protein n=3 Tax=Brassica TaxID=3705 RepID=A0A078GA73_BRANA|nr:BnaA08g12110D [Brassica napus]